MISRDVLALILFVAVLLPLYTYTLTKRGYINFQDQNFSKRDGIDSGVNEVGAKKWEKLEKEDNVDSDGGRGDL